MSGTGISDLRSSAGRKLIAVLLADMVGYSRLIGMDDVGTLNGGGHCAARSSIRRSKSTAARSCRPEVISARRVR